MLINYPDKKELKDIIEKVLGEFHDERYRNTPEVFSNLERLFFINKFSKKIHQEMTSSKYAIKLSELRPQLPEGMEDEEKILFTGADVRKTIEEVATTIMNSQSRRTLQDGDFVRAISRVFEYNKATGG